MLDKDNENYVSNKTERLSAVLSCMSSNESFLEEGHVCTDAISVLQILNTVHPVGMLRNVIILIL